MYRCPAPQPTCSNHNDAINMWPQRDAAQQIDPGRIPAPVQSLCRLCMLQGGATMEDIFHGGGSATREDGSPSAGGGAGATMAGQITWVTQIKVHPGDGLPSHVCQQCIFQLNLALTFKERCLNTDTVLRQIYLAQVEGNSFDEASPVKDNSFSSDTSHNMIMKVEPLSPCNFQDADALYPDPDPDPDLPLPDDVKIEIVEHNVGASVCEEASSRSVRGGVGAGGRLTCDTCRKTYPTWDQLRRHLRNHLERRISCPHCAAKFHRPAHLKRHVAGVHLDERPHACAVCNKSFGTLSTLQTHERSHRGEKPFACRLCDKRFAHQSTLTTHVRGAHLQDRAHKCAHCPRSFAAKGSLTKHERIHTNDRRHKCDLCPKAFTVGASLRLHKLTHTGERPHECAHCGKLFGRVQGLIAHVRTHTGERPYACRLCPKTFIQHGSLAAHYRTHDHVRPYKCAVCAGDFAAKKTLARHIRTHTGERDYACELCEKRFARDTGLELHMRTHTKERPHACTLCGKQFRQQATLGAHMRTHTGERPYRCHQCDACFRQKGTLVTHMRRHTGDKPFKCGVCSDTFAQTGNLNDHMLRHHSEKAMAKKLMKMLKELEERDANEKAERIEYERELEEKKKTRKTRRDVEKDVGGRKVKTEEESENKMRRETEEMEVERNEGERNTCGERVDTNEDEEEMGMMKIMAEIKERKARKLSKASVHSNEVDGRAMKRLLGVGNKVVITATANVKDEIIEPVVVPASEVFTCQQCFETFPREQSLISHNENCHAVDADACGAKDIADNRNSNDQNEQLISKEINVT